MTNEDEANCLPAGRYEFKDSGIYIGEWLNEKAVGLGLITKDKSQGEFTGLWNAGEEKSGVFLWPNAPGAMYEGEWAQTKRNGYGIFTREDWVIMGEFSDDFIDTGIKCKDQSIGRFEGEFENGFPSFGVETYADGGTYAGEYKNGIREGVGVRTSIPYGEVFTFFPEDAAQYANGPGGSASRHRRDSLTSQRSGAAGFDDDSPLGDRDSRGVHSNVVRMTAKFKCGFVLSGQRSDLTMKRLKNVAEKRRGGKARSMSSVQGPRTSLLLKSARGLNGSIRSSHSAATYNTIDSIYTLDAQHEDTIDPEAVETFSGEWQQDARSGYGVCERSDGVTYEGQWHLNMRHGYGVTHFSDGSCEEGRYHNGELVYLWTKQNPLLFIYTYHKGREIDKAIKKAREAAERAKAKAAEANKNLTKVKEAVEKAKKATEIAREYSLETRALVKEMYPEFEQPGIKYLQDIVRLMKVTKRGNQVFEQALQSAVEIVTAEPVPNESSRDPSGNLLMVRSDSGSFRSSRRGSFRRTLRRAKSPASGVEGSTVKGNSSPMQEKPIERRKNQLTAEGVPNDSSTENFDNIYVTSPSMEETQYRRYREGDGNDDTSSITSTYLLVPDAHNLQPISDIPTVPLGDLLTSAVLSDHFDCYSQSQTSSPAQGHQLHRSPPIIKQSPIIAVTAEPNFTQQTNHFFQFSPPSSSGLGQSINTSSEPQPFDQYESCQRTANEESSWPNSTNLVDSLSEVKQVHIQRNAKPRRRTLPSFMTSPPVSLNVARAVNNNCIVEEVAENGEPANPTDRGSSTDDSAIYVIENGIRKRAFNTTTAATVGPSPVALPSGRHGQFVSPSMSTGAKLGGGAIFESPQDELMPLPASYHFESVRELKKDLGEGSLPDVRLCRQLQAESPMTKEEAWRLSEESRRRRLEELVRRGEGEIKIQLAELGDWCQRHILLIFVAFLNLGLSCVFLYLMSPIAPK